MTTDRDESDEMTELTEAQKVIREVLCNHPEMVIARDYAELDRNECLNCIHTNDWVDHVATEIDKALGGLGRQWAVRYTDGGVTTRPSPGLPSPDVAERVKGRFTDREVVIGWVSGWSEA